MTYETYVRIWLIAVAALIVALLVCKVAIAYIDIRIRNAQRHVALLKAADAELARVLADVRPEILSFALLMEDRMRVGDRRGWTLEGCNVPGLAARAAANARRGALLRADRGQARECFADAANLSMLAESLLEAGERP